VSGIVGVFSTNNHANVSEMLAKIHHRGSVESKIWKGPNSNLGAVGLSSLQEDPGPIATPSGTRAIVWDGWLLNHEALRKELTIHKIDTNSEAETVLHLFEERGPGFAGDLEGHFALAIVDEHRLLLARDRLGVCPLYYGFSDGALFFASEIKALVDFVEEVHEFPPGHFLLSDRGMFPYQPYLPEPVRIDGPQESAERLGDLLDQAVDACLPEGVDAGVWLSGGVDSSVLAALAQRKTNTLYTFSAGVEGAADLEYAEQVANHIGSKHYARIYTLDDVLDVLDAVIYNLESFDAPLVRSAVGNYLVAELASNHVPFVLSGEGGDELFAGYAYQKMCTSEVELTLSVQQAIGSLHNTALQRVDRSAAAHSTKAGIPFLDPRVVRYALAIPSRWKIRGPQDVEKWPLREALSDTLPGEIIWRGKAKFWEGAGAADMLNDYVSQEISDETFEDEAKLGNGFYLHSKEELLYYRYFKSHFGVRVPIREVGRTQHI
jgi:asparagine synthase (glutamine-hydrolysing)